MVSKWLGVRDSGICGKFIVSTVRGRQFTMASASTMKVLRVWSSSWVVCCVRSDANTFRTVRIWRSQAPPIWLASGTFVLKSIQSQFLFASSCCIFSCWLFCTNKVRTLVRSQLSHWAAASHEPATGIEKRISRQILRENLLIFQCGCYSEHIYS